MSPGVYLATVLAAAPVDSGVRDAGSPDAGAPAPTWAQALVLRTTARQKSEELLDEGRHVRFGTDGQGPVHVWVPPYFKPATASVIVYLHGYFTDVDRAFEEHRLSGQFRDSRRNAVFIVPEAPSARVDPVYWADLDVLLEAAFTHAGVERPRGPLVVVGHSGAYRTIIPWLTHEHVKQLVLIDALYTGDDEFHRWLSLPEGTPRQLVMVGLETSQRTDLFLKRYPGAVRLPDVPYLNDAVPASVRNARVLYLGSERFDHMELVTTGRVLPRLLALWP